MRKATPLRPVILPKRSASEVKVWMKRRDQWLAEMRLDRLFHPLFEHIPDVHFFAKDREGHLMFATRSLLRRYKMNDDMEFIGRTDYDINPPGMAESYVQDDQSLLEGREKQIEKIELWWDVEGLPDWYHVIKLPLMDRRGRVAGVMGILRLPRESERQLPVFQAVSKAVELIRRDFARPLVIAEVARQCGQSVRQLQRRFQSAFGMTPQAFLLQTRVVAATRMLEDTAWSASEIAQRCGFGDASSFSQHFRRRTGVTPTAHRRAFQS
jgi:AraC-like DNA-binding protein